MKRNKTLLITLLLMTTLLLLILVSAVFAQGDGETILIESGKTIWQYKVTTTNGFSDMNSAWNTESFDRSSWKKGVSPFGDRLSGGTDSGWEDRNHGIFLVTSFEVENADEIDYLIMDVFYDNTVKVYLNGYLAFSDTGWNDAKEEIFISSKHLQNGKNTFAVSLLDDVGGREFDLTLKTPGSTDIPEQPLPPEQLIAASDTNWYYKVTTTSGFHDMDEGWIKEGFDISSWNVGKGPFGDCISSANARRTGWQGDNHGIFLITTFEIDDLDKAQNKSYYAEMYFDNTITIYLNGNRVFYHERWNTSYEEIVLGFKNYLKEGKNILAISLLDDVGGREFDMSLYMTDVEMHPDTEVGEEELTEAGLPILRIDTESGDYIRSRLDYVDATMVFENLTDYPDEDHMYTTEGGAAIEIRGRGNSTWSNGYPDGKPNTLAGDTHTRKVGYNVKLDKKTDLFGMGKSKKWVLLANYMDRTNLRNKLIFDLSGRMGMTYPESIFVNLVLNGEYMGVYALCEKVDIDLLEDRVTDFEDYAEDFAKEVAKTYGYDDDWQSDFEDELCENLSWLTEDTYKGYRVADFVDLSGVSTDGGFIIEYDSYADEDSFFTTSNGVPLKVSNLEYIKSNPEMFNNLKAYFNDFEEALFSDTFYNSKGNHYSEYLDMQSFVDYFILNTLILNVEFGYKSMYMTVGTDGKITMGPCWDYDWSSGNPFLGANGQYDQWYNDGRANNNKWYREVYGDPYFIALVRERWVTLSSAVEDMIESMDYYEDYLLPSTVIEYRKFKADSYERDFAGRTGGRSFSEEVAQLRAFLINRYEWMNTQFDKREPNIEGFGMKTNTSLALTLVGTSQNGKDTLFDYAIKESGNLSLHITSPQSGKAVIYLNGIRYTTLSLVGGMSTSIALVLDDFAPGANTLTVYGYDSNNNLFGTNYLTLRAPGEKVKAPTLGSFLPDQEEEPITPPVDPPVTEPPVTEPPVTEPPVTEPPMTEPPVTEPPVTEPPVTEPPAPQTIPLAAETIDVYYQTTAPKDGTISLLMVFVVDEVYLDSFSVWNVTVVFTTKDGATRRYNGTLGENGDYELLRKVTAENDTYIAAEGDCLFGNVFTGVPDGEVEGFSVTITSQSGEELLKRSTTLSSDE